MDAYYYGRLESGNTHDKENGVHKMMLEELVSQLVNKRASEQDKKIDKALENFQKSSQKLIQEIKDELESLQKPRKRNNYL